MSQPTDDFTHLLPLFEALEPRLLLDGGPQLTVVGFTPDPSRTLSYQPVDFAVRFSEAYLPASVNPGDLRVNDIAANSFALTNATTITFHYNASPITVYGPQELSIDALSLVRQSDGAFNAAWKETMLYSPELRLGSMIEYAVGGYAVIAADLNGDGRLDLVTGGEDGDVSVLLNNASGTFANPVAYDAGDGPYAIAAGDFNEDGRLDLAVGDSLLYMIDNGVYKVSVLLNNGDGTFAPRVPYAVGDPPNGVVAVDFDGDGHIDLATANSRDDTVSVLLGYGDGTFADKVDYSTGEGACSVVAADFNEDGLIDLATANADVDTLSVLLGNGDGTFADKVDYAVDDRPVAIVAADFDHDGNIDLATANRGGRSVSVLSGNGDGAFGTRTDFESGSVTSSMAAADFNDDGWMDLVEANETDGQVRIMMNDGAGGFTWRAWFVEPFIGSSGPYGVATGDLDGDGMVDAAAVSQDFLGVLINKGDGILTTDPVYPTAQYPRAVIMADIDNDGALDLVLTNASSGSLSVLPNNGDGTFAAKADYSVGEYPYSVAAGDFNNDGWVDLAATNSGNGGDTIQVLFNNGDGTFADAVIYTPGRTPNCVAAGDIDRDGWVDLVVAGGPTPVYLNNGDGTFVAATGYTSLGANWVVTVDLNGDGWLDLAMSRGSNGLGVRLNNGDGAFAGTVNYATGAYAVYVTAGDFNGDGVLDLATANQNDNTVSVLLNNGDGTFGARTDFAIGVMPYAVASGDFNGDGLDDLATANDTSKTLTILLSNGDGTFARNEMSAWHTRGIAAGDLNGDGRPDLVISNNDFMRADVFLNNGNGTFTQSSRYIVGGPPSQVVSADLNGDGMPDLAVSAGSNAVRVLTNNGNGSFPAETVYPLSTGGGVMEAADLNGDGWNDLAVESNTGLVILLNNCDGTFTEAGVYGTGGHPGDIAAADFNGDGWIDLAVTMSSGNQVAILLNNGDGTFNLRGPIATGFAPHSLTVGDFDHDGDPDIAVAATGTYTNPSTYINVHLNRGDATFANRIQYYVGPTPECVVSADFNGDGWVDLAASAASSVNVLLNRGNGTFGYPLSFAAPYTTRQILAADFNGDCAPDLAVRSSDMVSVYLNKGDGTLTSPTSFIAGASYFGRMAVDNFSGDGRPSLAVLNYDMRRVEMLINRTNYPPSIIQSDINGGQSQRSCIDSISFGFNRGVEVGLSSFTLHNNTTGEDADLIGASLSYNPFTMQWTLNLTNVPLDDGEYVGILWGGGVTDSDFNPLKGIDYRVKFTRLCSDAGGDGKVDGGDLQVWQQHYDPLGIHSATNSAATGDWDGNGKVDGADLALWQAHYCPLGLSSSGEPEALPEELALGGAGSAAPGEKDAGMPAAEEPVADTPGTAELFSSGAEPVEMPAAAVAASSGQAPEVADVPLSTAGTAGNERGAVTRFGGASPSVSCAEEVLPPETSEQDAPPTAAQAVETMSPASSAALTAEPRLARRGMDGPAVRRQPPDRSVEDILSLEFLDQWRQVV